MESLIANRKEVKWVGNECASAFQFVDAEGVAKLWCLRNKKPDMSYDAFRRTLIGHSRTTIAPLNKERKGANTYKFTFDMYEYLGCTLEHLKNRSLPPNIGSKMKVSPPNCGRFKEMVR